MNSSNADPAGLPPAKVTVFLKSGNSFVFIGRVKTSATGAFTFSSLVPVSIPYLDPASVEAIVMEDQ